MQVKKWLLMAGLLTVGVGAARAHAEDIVIDLAKAKLCMACHQVDERRVGPSLRVIAERYAQAEGALAYLAYSIRHGGRGRWGAIAMPKQPQVSEDEAVELAQWILTLTQPKAQQP